MSKRQTILDKYFLIPRKLQIHINMQSFPYSGIIIHSDIIDRKHKCLFSESYFVLDPLVNAKAVRTKLGNQREPTGCRHCPQGSESRCECQVRTWVWSALAVNGAHSTFWTEGARRLVQQSKLTLGKAESLLKRLTIWHILKKIGILQINKKKENGKPWWTQAVKDLIGVWAGNPEPTAEAELVACSPPSQ